jgi:hypothetical protein
MIGAFSVKIKQGFSDNNKFREVLMRIILLMMFLTVQALPAIAGSVTLTAYYPVPNGDYNNLTVASNIGVGTTMPDQNLVVKGIARLVPTNVGALPVASAGSLAVNSVNNQLYVSNGSAWNQVGGGGTPSGSINWNNCTVASSACVDNTWAIVNYDSLSSGSTPCRINNSGWGRPVVVASTGGCNILCCKINP